MKETASLRARVLTGAIAWSVGLFVLASVALGVVMELHPGAPVTVHRWLEGPLPIVFAVACLLAGFLQVRSGLSGVDRIRRELGALHAGRQHRLDGAYPSEVQPLVTDLNILLDERDRVVDQARAKAGDLAHGLKTPLAVLAHEADRAAASGGRDLAAAIRQQVDRMRRQVDYHLAQARALSGPSPGDRCVVRDSLDGLVRALNRLHADRGIAISTDVDPELSVRGLPADIEEMLGNLLDNGCRWARSRVAVAAHRDATLVTMTIDDDGPGIDPAMWDTVLQRGVRADESEFGSGLGLAIVRNLADLYEGSITLGRSPLGGLRATLTLPA